MTSTLSGNQDPSLMELTTILQHSMSGSTDTIDALLQALLRAARTHFGMEIGFISTFSEHDRLFRYLDVDKNQHVLEVGTGDPLEDTYCQRVVDGRLPGLIQDAQHHPVAQQLPVTQEFPIGAHLSVPITLQDGSVYGTFCCFSTRPDYSLNTRDLTLLRAFADVAGTLLQKEAEYAKTYAEQRRLIAAVVEGDGLMMVWQPITDLLHATIVGLEALARFTVPPIRPPDQWFHDAAHVGLAEVLEMAALTKGLMILEHLPPTMYVTVNLSAKTILTTPLQQIVAPYPKHRIVVEITEHDVVNDYRELARVMHPLRAQGIRLAVDDVGAGYASFRHILYLDPDIIKLDMSLTHDIDTHQGREALVAALVGFAHRTGIQLVAEGVETDAQLQALQNLGVTRVQGYLLHKPMPQGDVITLLRTAAQKAARATERMVGR